MKATTKLDALTSKRGAHYISAVVLGMNDALVEMTGALAGFTIALQNNRLIVLAGITTGVAATLSMATAEFLSKETDQTNVSSYWSAICTGIAYLITVAILLLPYFFCKLPLVALLWSFFLAVLVIFFFTYTISKIRSQPFLPNFKKMLIISFVVAAIAFLISWCANLLWGLEF